MTSPHPRWILLVALAGCAGEAGGLCEEQDTPMAASATSPLGASPEAIADQVEGTHQASLATHDAPSTPLELTLTWDGDASTWTEREPRDPHGTEARFESASEPVCLDALVLPMELSFRTADGRFDERWTVDLEATSADHARFVHRVDARRLRGDWEPDQTERIDATLVIEGRFGPDGPSGELRLVAPEAPGEAVETWTIGVWPAG